MNTWPEANTGQAIFDALKADMFTNSLPIPLTNESFRLFLGTDVRRVKAWEVAFKHGDDIRLNTDFLSNLSKHLDDFPNLKPDLDDVDVFNAYKKIADDVDYGKHR